MAGGTQKHPHRARQVRPRMRPARPDLSCQERARAGAKPGAPGVAALKRSGRMPYSFPNRAAVSDMRFEKPHSLSYQPITRTMPPLSRLVVCEASTVQLAGLVL